MAIVVVMAVIVVMAVVAIVVMIAKMWQQSDAMAVVMAVDSGDGCHCNGCCMLLCYCCKNVAAKQCNGSDNGHAMKRQ